MLQVVAQLPTWAVMLLVVLFMGVCVLLILTVLIQKPQGGGLAGAFGSGAGSGQTAFGAKTGDALTIATIFMFCVFVLGAIGLNYATRPPKSDTVVTPAAAPALPGTTEQPESRPPEQVAPAEPVTGEPTAPQVDPEEPPAGEPGSTPPGGALGEPPDDPPPG